MLDAQTSDQHRNNTPAKASTDDVLAIQAWNLLANGMGGLDWAGLPLVVAHLGITDVASLLHRLQVIKAHKPPTAGSAPAVD